MLRKSYTKTGTACQVTFKLVAGVNAESVALVGDFNYWNPEATPMKKLKDGSFSATVALTAGESYHFRYLLDGERWENDPEADAYKLSVYRGKSVNNAHLSSQAYLIKLYELLMAHFNESELKTLCFYLSVDYETLSGEGKANKTRELVQYSKRHDLILRLEDIVTKQRPHISWPDMHQSLPPEPLPGSEDSVVIV